MNVYIVVSLSNDTDMVVFSFLFNDLIYKRKMSSHVVLNGH